MFRLNYSLFYFLYITVYTDSLHVKLVLQYIYRYYLHYAIKIALSRVKYPSWMLVWIVMYRWYWLKRLRLVGVPHPLHEWSLEMNEMAHNSSRIQSLRYLIKINFASTLITVVKIWVKIYSQINRCDIRLHKRFNEYLIHTFKFVIRHLRIHLIQHYFRSSRDDEILTRKVFWFCPIIDPQQECWKLRGRSIKENAWYISVGITLPFQVNFSIIVLEYSYGIVVQVWRIADFFIAVMRTNHSSGYFLCQICLNFD